MRPCRSSSLLMHDPLHTHSVSWRIDDRTGRIVKNDISKKEDGDGDVVSLSQVHLIERQKKICVIIENNPFVSSKQMPNP